MIAAQTQIEFYGKLSKLKLLKNFLYLPFNEIRTPVILPVLGKIKKPSKK